MLWGITDCKKSRKARWGPRPRERFENKNSLDSRLCPSPWSRKSLAASNVLCAKKKTKTVLTFLFFWLLHSKYRVTTLKH